jgi:RNA polymerase sigma-70 factor (ECF subfamily)
MVSVTARQWGGFSLQAQDAAVMADVALAQKAASGDQRAFAQLVTLYQRRVFSVAVRMLGDTQEAEDVAQEVFVALHGALKGFRVESRLSTWIYRITRNHCLNRIKYLNRRGRRAMAAAGQDRDGEDTLQQVRSPGPSPARQLESSQDARALEAALQQLPHEQRLLVVLREVEQLSYEEMVQITGLPEGTIKSRLHRARAALLGALPELQEDHHERIG